MNARLLEAWQACRQASVADKLAYAAALEHVASEYVDMQLAQNRVDGITELLNGVPLPTDKEARVAETERRIFAWIQAASASRDGQRSVFAAAILAGSR